MKLDDFKLIIRISWKIILSWIIVIFIFFLRPLNVNLQEQINRPFQTDKIIVQDTIIKNNKSIKCITTEKIKKKHIVLKYKPIKKKISEKEKYKFLLSIIKQAFLQVHWSSTVKNNYNKLCSYYGSYCKIIDINTTDFNYQDKTYYTWLTVFLLKYLNSIFYDVKQKIYYIKIQKSKTWRRGYAWHHTIVINVKDDMTYKEFYEVLTHELWHIVDLWLLEWSSSKKSSIFKEYGIKNFAEDDSSLIFYRLSFTSAKVKKPSIYAKDFVGWYAMTNVFEDFAETFNMYVNHNYVFRKMAKESNILQEKYNFLNKILKWKYLLSDKKFYYKYGYRPWDTTRMK